VSATELDVLRAADPAFGEVADTLVELANDRTVSPAVYDRVCAAVFAVLGAWAARGELTADGEPVGLEQVAGLTVAFKALVLRAGGVVELTEAELEHGATLRAMVTATAAAMRVELVDGDPPDVPRFAP